MHSRTSTPALVFTWAAAEATVWFVPADYLLAALVLHRPHRWRTLLTACVGGMAAGGLVSLVAARARPEAALAVVSAVRGVTPERLDRVRALLERHGAPALLLQPVSGIPFKAWAAVLGPTDVTTPIPLAVSAPALLGARTARMAGTALLARLLARLVARGAERWRSR